jgi:hypothetical protein
MLATPTTGGRDQATLNHAFNSFTARYSQRDKVRSVMVVSPSRKLSNESNVMARSYSKGFKVGYIYISLFFFFFLNFVFLCLER